MLHALVISLGVINIRLCHFDATASAIWHMTKLATMTTPGKMMTICWNRILDPYKPRTVVTCPPDLFPHAVYTVQSDSPLAQSCLHHDQLANRVYSTVFVVVCYWGWPGPYLCTCGDHVCWSSFHCTEILTIRLNWHISDHHKPRNSKNPQLVSLRVLIGPSACLKTQAVCLFHFWYWRYGPISTGSAFLYDLSPANAAASEVLYGSSENLGGGQDSQYYPQDSQDSELSQTSLVVHAATSVAHS